VLRATQAGVDEHITPSSIFPKIKRCALDSLTGQVREGRMAPWMDAAESILALETAFGCAHIEAAIANLRSQPGGNSHNAAGVKV
jgi:hypothetical protein